MIDYNKGNPDGVLDAGRAAAQAARPARRDLPEGGHALPRQPVHRPRRTLGRPPSSRPARSSSRSSSSGPRASDEVLEFGFRPGNRDVAIGDPIAAPTASTRTSRRRCSRSRSPSASTALLDRWAQQRKAPGCCSSSTCPARWAIPRTRTTPRPTKLDLAKQAAIDALDEFKPDDEVGLRIFTTDVGDPTERLDPGRRTDRPDRRTTGKRWRRRSTTCSRSTAPRSTTSTRDTYTDMSVTSTRRGSMRSSCSPTDATKTANRTTTSTAR